MGRFEQVKDKYNDLVRSEIAKNSDILKESLVEYFGEENRSLIEAKFKEIVFIYYVNWETINMVTRKLREEFKDNFKPYFEFKEARESVYFSFVNDKVLPDEYVGTTDEGVFRSSALYMYVLERIKQVNPYAYIVHSFLGEIRMVCFNLFLTSERSLIHEVLHNLTCEWILRMEEEKVTYIVEKSGLNVFDDRKIIDKNLEELINDLMAEKVYEIFKRRGGDLTSFLMGNVYEPVYDYNHYLVKGFFSSFEEPLKNARLKENMNAIINRVGKSNYNLLCEMVNLYYQEDRFLTPAEEESILRNINPIINAMKEYDEAHQEMNEEEISEYLKSLEKMGKTITLINKN